MHQIATSARLERRWYRWCPACRELWVAARFPLSCPLCSGRTLAYIGRSPYHASYEAHPIPTSVTANDANHSVSSESPATVDLKVRVLCSQRRLVSLGKRTVATTLSRCTSRPAHRSTTTSIVSLLETINIPSPRGDLP
jgi:hypothetical protein